MYWFSAGECVRVNRNADNSLSQRVFTLLTFVQKPPFFLSIKSALLVGILFLAASCSLCREKNVQDIIDNLPRYSDNTPVMWDSLSPECLRGLKTIGDLKKALRNGLDPNKPIAHGGIPSDFLIPVFLTCDDNDKGFDKKLKSRLAALDVLLNAGANPQRMNYSRLVTEEEYALYIKHGLSAKEPIQIRDGFSGYPLTNRVALLSPPIVKWLLENGADPNQLELNDYCCLPKISPLSNVITSPKELLGLYDYVIIGPQMNILKTEKYKETIKKLLIEQGATVCSPLPKRFR